MKQEINNNFFQTLKHFEEMPEVELPVALHGRIMRSLYLQQFRLPLVFINGLLLVNLSISGYHLWGLNQGGFREAYRILAETPSTGSVFASASQAIVALPLETSAVFLANLALMAAGIYLLRRLRTLTLMAKVSK